MQRNTLVDKFKISDN
jgi:oligopeptidase B